MTGYGDTSPKGVPRQLPHMNITRATKDTAQRVQGDGLLEEKIARLGVGHLVNVHGTPGCSGGCHAIPKP